MFRTAHRADVGGFVRRMNGSPQRRCNPVQSAFIARSHVLHETGFMPRSRRCTTNARRSALVIPVEDMQTVDRTALPSLIRRKASGMVDLRSFGATVDNLHVT